MQHTQWPHFILNVRTTPILVHFIFIQSTNYQIRKCRNQCQSPLTSHHNVQWLSKHFKQTHYELVIISTWKFTLFFVYATSHQKKSKLTPTWWRIVIHFFLQPVILSKQTRIPRESHARSAISWRNWKKSRTRGRDKVADRLSNGEPTTQNKTQQ